MAIYADGTRVERSKDEDADQKHVDSKTKYNSKHIFAIIGTVQHYETKL